MSLILRKRKKSISVWKILSLGFVGLIVLGTILLLLPISTNDGYSTSVINALFTATSATCVTGLVPYDTSIHFSLFGQIVLIILIQTGGLGFMTIVSILFSFSKKNVAIHTKNVLLATTGGSSYLDLKRLLRRILLGTLVFEVLGAIVLSIRFIPLLGIEKGIYYSIFHSISAFCNAGFDLFGNALPSSSAFCSLTIFKDDPLVLLTICCLIIIGGIGFVVWGDIIDHKFKLSKYSLHSKVTLMVTLILIVIPSLLYLFANFNNSEYVDLSLFEKITLSIFNVVTPRTAGFSAVDYAKVDDSSYLLMILLMFIGGGSASTAGGVKMTSIAVIVMGMITVFRGKRDINIGKKRIDFSLVNQALAVMAACLILICIASFSICLIEGSNVTIKEVLFEVVSANATVGLSLGLTPRLSDFSKFILILLMYAGRVGIVTLALSIGHTRHSDTIRKPVDSVLIG